MSSLALTIFQFAEAAGAISLPVGGGLAAFSRWRRSAERDRRLREDSARIASETAAREARKEEQAMRDALLKEKDERLVISNREIVELRAENDRLHDYIVAILSGQRPRIGEQSGGNS